MKFRWKCQVGKRIYVFNTRVVAKSIDLEVGEVEDRKLKKSPRESGRVWTKTGSENT